MPDDPRSLPILFLHGLGATCHMWDEHARWLAEFRCIAPDLPGHGSAAGRPWLSLDVTAAAIATLIEGLPEGRAHVVGLSLGGAVALELLVTRPDLLGRVVVDGASAIEWRWARPLRWGVAPVSPFVHSRPFMRVVATALGIGANRREAFYRDFRRVSSASFRRAIRDALDARIALPTGRPAPDNPVLLVAGEHDVGAARESNATLARLLPNATARYVRGARHAWVANRPDLHKEMVRAFLTDAPLPAGILPETRAPRAPRGRQGTRRH